MAMQRLFMIFAIGLTVAAAPAADAGLPRTLSADKNLVNLNGGRGVLWGGFARGRIRVTDLPSGAQTVVKVYGADRVTYVNATTRVYSGRYIRFSIHTGRWKAGITARGINASAVLKGVMWLGGTAGTYTIEDSAQRPWPLELTQFTLGE
jgi:hypothetical protein